MAIPEDEIYGINFKPLMILIPLGVALGLWNWRLSCDVPFIKIITLRHPSVWIVHTFSPRHLSGVWVVGNVGREEGSIWVALVSAYACYPTLTYLGDDSTWMSLMVLTSAIAFDTWSKKWRLKPAKKRGFTRRIAVLGLAVLLYSSLWGSYFYFNARFTDSEGEEIKLSEAVKHFLTSPIWLDLKVQFFKISFTRVSMISYYIP